MGTFTEELAFGPYKVGIWDEPPSYRTIRVEFFSPADLFAAGEQGAWYDPSDLTSMFQDSAGTIPVTASGDVVGKINDKSGRGNHATQGTTASKPIYRDVGGLKYLEFDGFDDFLATAAVDFSATDEMTVCMGARKLSDAATFVLLENTVAAGTFRVFNLAGVAGWTYGAQGSFGRDAVSPTTYPAPSTVVLTGYSDISADQTYLRLNGAAAGSNLGDLGTGDNGNYAVYLGRRNGTTLPFSGNVYQLVIRGKTTADLTPLETYVNSKTGAY
jgi:hypothetical protein